MKQRKSTSVEVARIAGVSQATVSRVFNGKKGASEAVRQRVFEVAKSLNYQPNVIARSLSSKSTNLIGIINASFSGFYAKALDELTLRLQDMGYSALVLNYREEHTDVENLLSLLLQYNVKAIILTTTTLYSSLTEKCATTGTPVLQFNRYAIGSTVSSVCLDNRYAGREIAELFIDNGLRKPAWISGPTNSSTIRDREDGFVQRYAEEGIDLCARFVGEFAYDTGLEAAKTILSQDNLPDAIFCATDEIAAGFHDCATAEFGLQIPEDLSLVGFDDGPIAKYKHYNLTSYAQPVEEMVEIAVKTIHDALVEDRNHIAMNFVRGKLVLRGTVALT